MRRIWIVAMALALVGAVGVGCPKAVSWEIAEKALSDDGDMDRAEVHRELQRAQKRAEEEIKAEPDDPGPYVTKASLQWINGDMMGAVETMQAAQDRSKPKTDAQKQALKEYLMAAYLRAGSPEMLKKGVVYVEGLIKIEGDRKNVYCYYMALYYRQLYQLLGEGVYKTEANRWILQCRLDPEMESEFRKEGLFDPFLNK